MAWLGITSAKDALLLALLVAGTSTAMVAGLYLQISPGGDTALIRAQEIEALLTSARCTPATKE